MICAGEERHALYRFYDARENLLYVGITDEPWRRWREHVRTQPWYPQVKHQAVTWYDTERQARRAETRAIRRERPKFNIAGALRPIEVRADLRSTPLGAVAVTWLSVPAACCGLARLVPVLEPLAVASIWSVLVMLAAAITIRSTPLLYRFGCWLDRNFGTVPAIPAAPAAALSRPALEILAAEPDISGAQLGLRLGKTERYGQMLKKQLTRSAAGQEAGS
jgi:hypothetical protein